MAWIPPSSPEPLEQRLLLSADGATPIAADVAALTVASDQLTATLVEQMQASPTVVIQALRAAAAAATPIDTGFVELDTGSADVRRFVSQDGTVDALIATGAHDNDWRITGEDTVTLNGVAYSGL